MLALRRQREELAAEGARHAVVLVELANVAPQAVAGPLPVVFLLSGFTGNGTGFLEQHPWWPGVVPVYDQGVTRGEAPPAILVMPNAFTKLGGSQYVNSSYLGQYEDYVARELVAFVDERFATLFHTPENLAELRSIIDGIFPTRSTDEWEERLIRYGQRYGRVKSYSEVIADETNVANGYVVAVDHPEYGAINVVGNTIRMSATPTVTSVVAPQLGQHTEEVLLEAGFGWDDIAELRDAGAL